jgi:hypothetical protein
MEPIFSESEVSTSSERPRRIKNFSSEPAKRFISSSSEETSSSGYNEKSSYDDEEEESLTVFWFFGDASSSAQLEYLRLLSLKAIIV